MPISVVAQLQPVVLGQLRKTHHIFAGAVCFKTQKLVPSHRDPSFTLVLPTMVVTHRIACSIILSSTQLEEDFHVKFRAENLAKRQGLISMGGSQIAIFHFVGLH